MKNGKKRIRKKKVCDWLWHDGVMLLRQPMVVDTNCGTRFEVITHGESQSLQASTYCHHCGRIKNIIQATKEQNRENQRRIDNEWEEMWERIKTEQAIEREKRKDEPAGEMLDLDFLDF